MTLVISGNGSHKENVSKMRKDTINKIKTSLESQRLELLNKKHDNLDLDIDGDDTDEIQAKILANTTKQLILREKEKLFKIDNAIKKIEDGSFGICEECGDEILEKRLLANPSVITCICCAEELELLAKQSRNR